ncbi:MAG: hypothetical protein AB1651_14190, partial [Pseudomonadota bacterium]
PEPAAEPPAAEPPAPAATAPSAPPAAPEAPALAEDDAGEAERPKFRATAPASDYMRLFEQASRQSGPQPAESPEKHD